MVGLCTFSTLNSNSQLAHYLCAFYLDTPTAFGAVFGQLTPPQEEGMSKAERMTVGVEELTLSNTLQLTAIVELLEERGIMTQHDVVERMRAVRNRKKPN